MGELGGCGGNPRLGSRGVGGMRGEGGQGAERGRKAGICHKGRGSGGKACVIGEGQEALGSVVRDWCQEVTALGEEAEGLLLGRRAVGLSVTWLLPRGALI